MTCFPETAWISLIPILVLHGSGGPMGDDATPNPSTSPATARTAPRRVVWSTGSTSRTALSTPGCFTPILVDLYRSRDQLDQETRNILEQAADLQSLPPSIGSVASSRWPLRVHYPSDDLADRAETVLELAEYAWEVEVEQLGFAAPVPDGNSGGDDRLDIYLASYDWTGGGAYTQPTYWDVDPTDEVQSCPAYIVLYEALEENLLPVYVAHELNHACQCAMDFQELTWAWETTATFVEDFVFDDVNDYYGYIPFFQAYPEQSLVYFDTSPPYAIYPYGATIFVRFLDEAVGTDDGNLVVELWEQTSQPGPTNEPDILDAVQSVATDRGWKGLEEVYGLFSLWRYFVGPNSDGAHFDEGADWTDANTGLSSVPTVSSQFSTADLPATGRVAEVCPFGTTYLLLDVDPHHADGSIEVTLEASGETHVGLAASRIRTGQPSQDLVLTPDKPAASLQTSVTIEGADQILLALLNLADTTYDPDDPETEHPCLTLSYSVALNPTPGCGCNATTGPVTPPDGTPGGILLCMLALYHVRRRTNSHFQPRDST